MLIFLINNYLNIWQQWPGLPSFFANQGWFGLEPLRIPLADDQIIKGWLQIISYLGVVVIVGLYVLRTHNRFLRLDADLLSRFSAYIIRAAFWIVLIIGIVDIIISFLRVENFMPVLIGDNLTDAIGRPNFRAVYVHFPLILLSLVIAFFNKSLGFTWLAFLVVLAEFQIVISRFVFSYEQPFMGDLVRFWYAALFLFASAYTLVHDGHVRVDVLYSRFNKRSKAWTNAIGTLLLGLPIGWVILYVGMADKTSSINSPLYSFEISQSGYGLYVKYLMVGFLAVYAMSMIVQFASYLLEKVADLRQEPGGDQLIDNN
ncbi:MAG: TRAP transporter small permease subunit [Deltaproteobacteria bacterium]|nr:TRAP transporter small permease subunit [Candidatus Desulfobacula maris]MBL6994254.1 TRAP transporter small permease subunit [Desulfobacula sp.]